MAEKKAGVRLEAKDSGFRRTLLGAENTAKASAKRMGAAYSSSLSAGMKGGIDSVRSMFSSIKSGMGQLTGLAGGIGLGALVKGAVDSEAKFRQLGFTLGAGRGEIEDWQELQKQAGDSALQWSQRSEDLADAMDTVFNTVGDVDFTKATLDEIAKAAQASGHQVSTIAPIVAEMNRQFGITADEVPDALAAVLSLGSRGGVSIEELGRNLGKMGRLAGVAGLQGQQGMQSMLGLINQITAASGTAEGSVEKVNMMVTKLADAATIKKQLGIDVAGLDAIQALEKVLAETKGDASGLVKVFGEQGALFAQAFGKRFEDVYKQTGGSPEQKLNAAIDDYRAAMTKASKASLTASDVQARANDNNKSAQSGLTRAVETMQRAFEKPEMQEAINSLAQNLPKLAEGVAKAIDFVMDNPALSAGVLVGGKAAMGAISSAGVGQAISGAFASGGASSSKAVSQAITGAGSSVAGSIRGALVSGGTLAAASIATAMAVEQAVKLGGELDQAERDQGDERENLLANAERQGQSYAVRTHRDKSAGDLAAFLLTGGLTAIGEEDKTEYPTRGKNGQVVVSDAPPVAVGMGGELSGSQKQQIDQQNARSMYRPQGTTAAGASQSSLADAARIIAAQQNKQPKPDHSGAARAMAEAIGHRTLNVKVTNASELRSAPGASGPPRPGHQGGL